MTRAELIRKISKQSGVPDSETKVFFEIFLKKLTALLKTGQALFINRFGYFYLVQGKISKSLSTGEEDASEYEEIELIYFSSNQIKEKTEFDGLFFNIPVSDEDEFNSVDAAFSLSFGKPLIPFKGIVESDFYIPHTGSELRRLIESKVDKTVENSTIIEVSEILSAVIDLDSDIYRKSKLKPDEEASVIGFEDYISEKDISKQIEEEQILDLADTAISDKEVKDIRPAVSWDFGGFEKTKTKEEEKKLEVPDDQIKVDDTAKIKIDYDKAESKEKLAEKEAEKKKEPKEKFERVKTLDKIIDETIDETVITIPFNILEEKKQAPLKEEPVKLIFDKKASEFIGIEPKARTIREEREKERVSKTEKASLYKTKRDIILLEEEKERFRQRHRKASSSVMPYIMLIVSIGIIAYGIYYYLNNIKGISKQPVQETKIQFNTERMNIIERDFDFPVSYPYPKRTEIGKDELSIFNIKKEEKVITKITEEPVKIVKEEKPKETPKEIKPEVNNQPPTGTVKRIGVNLFQYGNVYIVQVAAFRSNSVAENEAGRFRNKGYSAFVERAEVDGTIWHRVKVGNFKDLKEAKKLAVQFK
ncbi:MAG: SPOR domain-containing protein [Ignavibacteriaceae bacterium]|nr:SPOR domain-containing protein [Ignavibacteriaceae bacterium]